MSRLRNHVWSSKDALNSSVFSWRRNAKYVDVVLTNEGNALQARTAATGKAQSPRAARRVDGTSSVDVDPDLRRLRDSMSDVESQQGKVAHCREGSGGQEHKRNWILSGTFTSEVLRGVSLRVLTLSCIMCQCGLAVCGHVGVRRPAVFCL